MTSTTFFRGITLGCLTAGLACIACSAHSMPGFVRDIAAPAEIPPPATDWSPSPRVAADLFSQAEAAYFNNEAATALRLLERAMRIDDETNPTDRDYYSLRAACMDDLGDTQAEVAITHYNHAKKAADRGDFTESRRLYELALVKDRLMLWAANNRAWLAATHHDPQARNDPDALAYALYACAKSEWHNWAFIDTLAAIYAENGDFDTAIRCAERALALAPSEHTQAVREAISLYRQKQPLRQPAAASGTLSFEDPNAPSPRITAEPQGQTESRAVISKITARQLAALLQNAGIAAEFDEDDEDGNVVNLTIDGYHAVCFVWDAGTRVEFYGAFSDETLPPSVINDWAASDRLSRVSVSDRGFAGVKANLYLSPGVTRDMIVFYCNAFYADFRTFLEVTIPLEHNGDDPFGAPAGPMEKDPFE